MQTLKKFWRVIVKSSADPKATSLFVRGVMLGTITTVTAQLIQALDIVCQFGYKCYYFDPSLIDTLRMTADTVTEVIYYGLMTIAGIMTFYGYVRKMVRTFTGTNPVLHEE